MKSFVSLIINFHILSFDVTSSLTVDLAKFYITMTLLREYRQINCSLMVNVKPIKDKKIYLNNNFSFYLTSC